MSPAPAPGHVRVFANAGVGHLSALRWADVREDHPQLQDWLVSRLVSRTGSKGEDAPVDLPQRCCGSVR